jgi:hypothetical protein
MTGLGFLAIGAFGIVAAIAEKEPQSEKKRLTRKSLRRRSRV